MRGPFGSALCQRRREHIDRGSTGDTLSLSLNRFVERCPQLKVMRLGGPICIDKSLFWPSEADTGTGGWLSLREMPVRVSVTRPDGGWYLDSDPVVPLEEPSARHYRWLNESDSEDDALETESESSGFSDDSFFAGDVPPPDLYDAHREGLRTGDSYQFSFRSKPNAALEVLLESAARIASVMPNLRVMAVEMAVAGCPRTDDDLESFESRFEAQGIPHAYTHILNPHSRPDWRVPRQWRMSDTLEAF